MSPEAENPNAAPGDLELVRSFVNTYDAELDQEDLGSPAELSAFLSRTGLGDSFDPSPADVERALTLREALRSLLFANNGADFDPAAAERLNAALAGAPLEVRIVGGQTELVPTGEGMDAAVARIGAIVRASMQSGDWLRLKACPDEKCQWAFYDLSRNRSRTWCDMNVCGNRAKVRAFRRRKSG